MGKVVVRLTVMFTALYLTLSYLIAQFLGVDILRPYYNLLFELCVVIYTFSEGKYHCKYMKYTALSIMVADVLTLIDNAIDFMSVNAHNIIPIAVISGGVITSSTLAMMHFYKVRKLNKERYEQHLQN